MVNCDWNLCSDNCVDADHFRHFNEHRGTALKMPTYNISTVAANLRFQMRQTAQGGAVFVKNAVVAYRLTSTAFAEITDIDYPSRHTYAVSSLTWAASTATFRSTASTSLATGMTTVIWGAAQAAYNVTTSITVTSVTTFTYTVTSSPASPATPVSSIFARGGKTTVPGVVYLNDRIYVQDIDGPIQNSVDGDVTDWNALAFITPEKESSNPIAIAKSLNYLVSFKEWDTEFFYDAGIAAPASPLAVENSAYLKLGCAAADSIVEFDGGVVFMSKRDQLQRSREIHVLNGLTPKKISTPEVERILNGSNLTTTYACYLSAAGHQLYTLAFRDTSTSIVYDFNNGFWYEWSFLSTAASTQISTANLTADGTRATAVVTAHGFNDGDPVRVSSVAQAVYNGIFNISRVDANTFTYELSSYPTVTTATSSATVMSVAGYTESFFPAVAYAAYQNLDLVLHETNGIIYSLESDIYQDTGIPINVHLRLAPWDGGNNEHKMISRLRVIGDRVASSSLIRYSDNDSSTYSAYRRLDMSVESAQLSRLGSTRRRVYEIRHTENTALRIEAIEQDAKQGK